MIELEMSARLEVNAVIYSSRTIGGEGEPDLNSNSDQGFE